jgi:hypothetical protein
MKYILILLALTFSLNSFAANKVCHDKENRYAKPEQLCDAEKSKCSAGMVCKEIDSNSKILSVVAGTGEKADTACKDVVQTQADKDAAEKAKQGKATGAGTK